MAKGDVRAHVVSTAAGLLAEQGPSGASLGDVLKAAGVSRGSTYHHFPDGKRELYAAALDVADEEAVARWEKVRGADPVEVTRHFFEVWREQLAGSAVRRGCAVLAVAVSGDDPDNVEYAGTVFTRWRLLLTSLLSDGGMDRGAAAAWATSVLAAAEGAVALARAEGSLDSFDVVAAQFAELTPQLGVPGES